MDILPLYINIDGVERGVDFCLLGVHLEQDLTSEHLRAAKRGPAETGLPEGSEEKQHLPETAGVLLSVLN